MAQRLKYKKSGTFSDTSTNVIIAQHGGDIESDITPIRNARWKPRHQQIDKLTAWMAKEDYGNLPVAESNFNSNFQNGDPAVFWQDRRRTLDVQAVDTTNDTFTVSGDRQDDFVYGGSVKIKNSTGNDGDYTVLDQSKVSYDSNNDETTIIVEEDITDSTADGEAELWENIFRGYFESQGVITKQGDHKITLWGFEKRTGKGKAGVSTAISTNIKDAMADVIPSDYTLDTPSSGNVDYLDKDGNTQTGFAPIEDYTLTGLRAAGYEELTKDYGYSLEFRPDKTIRYEPIGFGGTIDTIRSSADYSGSDTLGEWLEWSDERTSGIKYTKIQVIGTDKDGKDHKSAVKENTSLLNDFGEIFKTFKVKFNVGTGTAGDNEVDRIAEQLINRTGQQPTEGGRVRVNQYYHTNVTNDSFDLKDSQRSIDAVYTCFQQTNYYSGGDVRSELAFEFETEDEREATGWEELRDERSRQFPDETTSKNTGGQSLEKGGTGDTPSDTGVTRNPDGVKNAKIAQGTAAGFEDNNTSTVYSGDQTVDGTLDTHLATNYSDDGDTFRQIVVDYDQQDGKLGYIRMKVIQYESGNSGAFITWWDNWHRVVGDNVEHRLSIPGLLDIDNVDGDIEIRAEWTGDNSTSSDFRFTIQAVAETEHAHDDDFGTSDNQHGGATIDNIIDVDTANDIVTVSGDETSDYSSSNTRKDDIEIAGSTGNDGFFTVSNVTLNGNGNTEITVNEDITDSTADGVVIPEQNHGLSGETLDKIIDIVAASEDKTDR